MHIVLLDRRSKGITVFAPALSTSTGRVVHDDLENTRRARVPTSPTFAEIFDATVLPLADTTRHDAEEFALSLADELRDFTDGRDV